VAPLSYQPGYAAFDETDPMACVRRSPAPLIQASRVDASVGQVGNACFAQTLVHSADPWIVYFGVADSRIGWGLAEINI
jgi:beta-1,2-mannosidase